jgi:arylsulfatase A-like enzyme
MARRPNLVLILADDLGYGDVGAFGNPTAQTPNLDRLASEGVSLAQHYSGSPMCAPARAALLTGRYPHRTGAIDVVECRGLDRIAPGERTIADLLKPLGYATGCIGKWHNGAVEPAFHPRARGFEEFVGFRGGLVASYWDWVIERNGSFCSSDGRYLTDVFTDAAVDFIHRHHDEPFFVYVPYNAPHTPLEAPEEDVAAFCGTEGLTRAVTTIYGMNRRMDAGIGRILAALDEYGLAEDTLVLFTSDNGPMFAGEGEASTVRYNGVLNGSKGSVLEGGIRVPGIVRWPAGLPGERRCNALTHFCDWLPTLLAAAGAAPPHDLQLDGHNILPVLRGDSAPRVAARFWQWNRYEPVSNCNAAVRDGPWKLVRPVIPEAVWKDPADNERTRFIVRHPDRTTDIFRGPVERALSAPRPARLFNLDRDPAEQHDLAATQPERAARLQDELDEWFAAVEKDRRRVAEANLRS